MKEQDYNEERYRLWVEQCGFGDADTPELRRNYNSGTEPAYQISEEHPH